jgi:hypothetical protein
MGRLFTIPDYDAALFSHIHSLPTYLSTEENNSSIREIGTIAAVITCVHLVLLTVFQRIGFSNSSSSSSRNGVDENDKTKTSKKKAAWKASYQLTNLLVNFFLGSMGIYHELLSSSSTESPSTQDKITGYIPIKHFATIQIAYQLWALPIGILFIGEQTSMIVHHIAVICVASTSTFLTCGFRYFIPFFYGVIEISSVPLSVMNGFKNNPDWIERYPSLYGNVRLVFGITFLVVRVVLWTPFYWDFISLATMLWWSTEVGGTKVILGVFNAASVVLTLLQYFWAGKIVSAMVKGAPKKTKSV